jgi:hypothetical protein
VAVAASSKDDAGNKISPLSAIPPPGNCSQQQHKKLQDEVNGQCKPYATPMTCKSGMSTSVRAAIGEANRQCGMARDNINNTCFAGGDKDHRNESIIAWKRYADCQ